MHKIILTILGILLSGNLFAQTVSKGDYYVSANRLSVRLGASINASITNTLTKKQKVEVFEVKKGGGKLPPPSSL